MSLAEAIPTEDAAPPDGGSPFGILFGRYMRPDQQEFPCQLSSIDDTQVTVITRGEADFSERLVLYLDEIGRLEGEVIHRTATGFTLGLSLSASQADRLQKRLEWLRNKDDGEAGDEQRRHARYQPSDAASQNAVAWSRDGKRLASGARDHTSKVFDMESGERLATYSGHAKAVRSV
ncbi:MAG: hypothetical protein AAF441_19420, partial [Pseudomonadota bacterium]